ncbi:MAG: YraN family protein [Armatimonadota bacterium]|nr:MAG: YraN family protein [Armatimonadota bacterium]
MRRKPRKAKTKQELARIGEDHAARYLRSRGYRVLERNFRARSGEVDIIAEQKDSLVFVEVKARSSNEFGEPREAVTGWKQRRIVNAARAYIARGGDERSVRFDVVEVFLTPEGGVGRIELIPHAFEGD